ncbi:MAG: cupin domain-containing protein [Gemmatimonadota bacterium]|nr:cupin domain-containing protein [Gemmatimonadota bacterium]
MRFIPGASRPPKEADPTHFVLPAFTQALIGREDDLPVRIYRVGFEPGARMGWHRHDAEQILIGLAGSCVVVNREGERILLEAGDVVVVEPDEDHWHGAPSGAKGEHLAINLGDETTWLE